MANDSPKSVSCKGALCYIWLTLLLLMVAIIIFAVATTERMVMYTGVICMMLSALCGCMYFLKIYYEKNFLNGDTSSSCCVKSCPCFKQLFKSELCHNIVKTVLCIEKENEQRTRRDSSSTGSALSFTVDISSAMSVYDVSDSHTITNTSSTASPRHSAAIATILQAFHHELQLLYNEYSLLHVDSTRVNDVLRDYRKMDNESTRLKNWIENNIVPTDEELNSLRHTLAIIQQNIYLARRGKTYQSSMTADMNSNIPEKPSTSVHQLLLYTTQMTEPPPYNGQETQESLNTSGVSNSNVMLLPPPSVHTYHLQQSIHPSSHTSRNNGHSNHQGNQLTVNSNYYCDRTRTSGMEMAHHENQSLGDQPGSGMIFQCSNIQNNQNNNVMDSNNSTNVINRSVNVVHHQCSESSQLSGSTGSLAPPTDDTGAPPSYEDIIDQSVIV